MTEEYKSLETRYVDYLIKLAAKNLAHGVIEEPRAYFDVIGPLLANEVESAGSPGVLFNGEQFPVRITHMSAAIRPDFINNVGEDERFIQRIGMRFQFHDQYYQSREFVPLPLWHNVPVAAADLVTQGNASYTFDRPNVLSARDSLRVEVVLEEAPAQGARKVSVATTGVGMLSRRPYFFSSSIDLADTTRQILDTEGFRNDGAEPVALTDMQVSCGPQLNDPIGQGDIRQLRFNIRQVGNGTQADWFQGPTVPTPLTQMPAVLAGWKSGRAIVHRFPGDGQLWEPGEGVTVDVVALDPQAVDLTLAISLYGYISVV